MPPYEELDHTADWALRIQGRDLAGLFLAAAAAMLAACGARPKEGPEQERQLSLVASDPEGLLVAWLEEVLYSLEVHRRLPIDIHLTVTDGTALQARWREVPLGGVDKPIKAVTYNNLAVVETEGGLEATIVFDV